MQVGCRRWKLPAGWRETRQRRGVRGNWIVQLNRLVEHLCKILGQWPRDYRITNRLVKPLAEGTQKHRLIPTTLDTEDAKFNCVVRHRTLTQPNSEKSIPGAASIVRAIKNVLKLWTV